MLELGVNYFGVIDYILLWSTLLISLSIGVYYGYKGNHTNEELLVGGRNMSILPVAASVMVTYVSAITILGIPSEVYANGGQIFMMQLVSAVGISMSAMVLVPFFYEMKLTSINEYLEKRFDSVWIRWLASGTFMAQQVFLSGVVLYAPSIALEAFLGFPMWMSVLGIGLCASIYTNIGGLKAVVWTDAFQCLMMVGSMLAIVWKGISASGGFTNAYNLASERGRLNFLDFTFDPFTRHNFWNFVIGTGLHSFMQPGIHQLQVQRYSGMPSCTKAKKAIIGSVPLKLIIMGLCSLTGFAIFAFYANCDPLSNGQITKADQIVPYFIVHVLAQSGVPGIIGLFSSCMFSAVLSSLSSSLNSLAAVTWEDFLVRINYFKEMTPKAQTNVSRITGALFGVICMGLAFAAQKISGIFVASYIIVGSTAGATYGVFIMAMFIPFVNSMGAIIGMLSGLIVSVIISFWALFIKSTKQYLPMSTEQCPIIDTQPPFEFLTNVTSTSTESDSSSATVTVITIDEWPWKFFTLSYLLYPVVAAVVAIIVGILVSILVSFLIPSYRKRKPSENLVHPLARGICRRFTISSRKNEIDLQMQITKPVDVFSKTYENEKC